MTDATTAPVMTDAQYHPDHPGPIGWLIYALHQRLVAIEGKLGLTSPAPAPVATPTATADPAPTPAHEGVIAHVETDVETAFHKLEDVLHIKHS